MLLAFEINHTCIYLNIPRQLLDQDNEAGRLSMKQTENWPFNAEMRRRFLFPGDDPDIGQIPEERLLFLFDFALTAKQKAILEDRYKDGLSAIETAEKEHISRGRVYALDRIIFKKLDLHKGRLLFDENRISAGTKISDVVTSTRICRALQRSGIDTIGDLYALKEDDLLKVRNLGEKGPLIFWGILKI